MALRNHPMLHQVLGRMVFVMLLVFCEILPGSVCRISASTSESDVRMLKAIQANVGEGPSSLIASAPPSSVCISGSSSSLCFSSTSPSSSSWGVGDPCNDGWLGVFCSTDSSNSSISRVTSLILSGAGLEGSFPSSVFGLSALRFLDLSLNPQLYGALSGDFSKLSALESLTLNGCSFSGSLPPALSQLKDLSSIIIGDNLFSGPLPPSIAGLSNLYYFDITNNSFSGELPVSPGLNNLSRLGHMHFSFNHFRNLPKEIGELQNLMHLVLVGNSIQTPLPSEIGLIPALTVVDVTNNPIGGLIPSSYFSTHLVELAANNCSLDPSPIPDVSPAINLMNLNLGHNSFQGNFPADSLSRLTNLITLDLSYNRLSGPLHQNLTRLKTLQDLRLAGNSFSGIFPTLTTLTNLQIIDLSQNNITNVFLDTYLYPNFSISLAQNPICGAVSVSLDDRNLCQHNLSASWQAGVLCPSLSCSANFFPSPYVLAFSQQCICISPFVAGLGLLAPSFNTFFDTVQASQERIIAQNITRAGLSLDPSQVRIAAVGPDPEAAGTTEIVIQVFPTGTDFSSEELTRLRRILGSPSNFSTLLGRTLGPFRVLSLQNPSKMVEDRNNRSVFAWWWIVLIVVLSVLLLATLVTLFIVQRRFRKAQKDWWKKEDYEALEGLKLQGVQRLRLAEILAATNNFSEESFLGQGGYGTVYKGVMENGEVVAVKRAKRDSQQGGEDFKNEIQLLSGVRHKNLVALLGYCREDGEQLLVYEFVSRGNLQDALKATKTAPLTWRQRLEIALGSAQGLAYLHDEISPPIIHRDIKPANILVNEKFEAKVADFGLSKVAPDPDDTDLQTKVKGTIGYLDPEYYLANRLTEKSDVYSFGVVLLELVTSLGPVVEESHIRRFVVSRRVQGRMMEIVDSRMTDTDEASLEEVAELALRCSSQSLEDRPHMREVVFTIARIARRLDPKQSDSAAKPRPPRDSESREHVLDVENEDTGGLSLLNPVGSDASYSFTWTDSK